MNTAGFTIGTARYGGTRHPFRATLPRRVLRALPQPEPEVLARIEAAEAAQAEAPTQPAPRWRFAVTGQDVKDFLVAYTACLLALLTFLG